jgi:hypothetical protein
MNLSMRKEGAVKKIISKRNQECSFMGEPYAEKKG